MDRVTRCHKYIITLYPHNEMLIHTVINHLFDVIISTADVWSIYFSTQTRAVSSVMCNIHLCLCVVVAVQYALGCNEGTHIHKCRPRQ